MRTWPRITALILGTTLFISNCKDTYSPQNNKIWLQKQTTETPQDYLKPSYANLLVEIDYDTTTPPDTETLNAYKEEILKRIQPKNITFRTDKIMPFGPETLTVNDLEQQEKITRDEYTGAGTITLHVYWLTKNIGTTYAGFQYTPSSIALFNMPQENDYTLSILLHETGHIMGLVNKGTQQQTEHSADMIHCATPNCVMEKVVNRGKTYCQNCIDDIIAEGGK